jgi:hypothetical protein
MIPRGLCGKVSFLVWYFGVKYGDMFADYESGKFENK